MGLQTFKQIPRDLAEWDRYFRAVPVAPDTNSVGDSELQDNAVTTSKVADNAIATPKIADNAVTNAKLRNSSACSVLGRAPNTDGIPSDIALDADGKFLVRRVGQLTGDTIQDADIPATIARDAEVTTAVSTAIATHVADADPHTQYQKESEKDSASGYAGLNGSSRTTKGVDATDDLVIDLATKGLVLKDTQGTPHYWRITISNVGAIVITDVGTTKP